MDLDTVRTGQKNNDTLQEESQFEASINSVRKMDTHNENEENGNENEDCFQNFKNEEDKL